MKYMRFINVSPIQFFDSTEYRDFNKIEDIHDCKNEDIGDVEPVKNKKEEIIEVIHDYNDDDDEIHMECFDDRDIDVLIEQPPSIEVSSNTLNISPNISEIPTGNKDGVIAKVPVILAQLTIPLSITSSINLPEEAVKIKDINKKLRLKECILLQPTNVLFIKGFINKNIEYSITNFLNLKAMPEKVGNYTIDIPFECSTPISYFNEPLNPIENTKKIFQSLENDLSTFHQISEEFFNEIPFCKLISSKIVEFDELIDLKNSKNSFIQMHEKMVIEIQIEILQNQPVVIVSANNKINKPDIL